MERNKELSKYLFQKAVMSYHVALRECDTDLEAVVNRSYYAIYNAIRAVFALENRDFKKHQAGIGAFNKEYVHTGKFNRVYGAALMFAFELRNNTDYKEFYIVAKGDAMRQLQLAHDFLKDVKIYLVERGIEL